MSKEKINVMIVLDETGSMSTNKKETLTGLNEYVDSLRSDKDTKYRLSLLLFNSNHMFLVYDNAKLKKVVDLTEEDYIPNAMTPLYDAVAHGVNIMSDKNGKILFVVLTDGFENVSKEYDAKNIADIIADKTKEGWQFVFLGANQDAWVTGGNMGIPRGQTISYDANNPQAVFTSLAMTTESYVKSGGNQTDTFFDETDIRDEN